MVSVAYSEAITEVLDILQHMEKQYVDKIPKKFKEFLENNKSKTYKVELDHKKRINEMDLKEKTKDILAVIYKNYWCDEEKKKEFNKILIQNEEKYQKELREKYNPDNLFKKSNTEIKIEEKSIVIVEEQKWYQKVFNFIKNIFKRDV